MVARQGPPVRGGIYKVSLDPTLGHEERGWRPILVISPTKYNRASGLVVVCPITSKQKGYPFEVVCKTSLIAGVILADQVRTLDWKTRKFVYVCDLHETALKEVQAKLLVLIK